MPDSDSDSGAKSLGTLSGKSTGITPEHRTEWKAILKHTKIHKADQTHIAQLAFETNIKNRIGKLSQENLTTSHLRRFQLLKSEADDILSKANHLNKTFISALLDQNSDIVKNPVYISDQENFYEALATLKEKY